jgi:FkbH-like protein
MRAAWTHPDPGRIEMVPALGETYENRNQEFLEAVFRQVEAIYRIAHQIDQVKLVIFDLDNTMWRGLLGEHYGEGHTWPYFDNWPMGVWEAVQHLRRRGIIVSIASKNDLDNVVSRWEDVVQFGFVKFDDFTCPQVNWNPKASNIANILSTLSLTPKSVVFVDDNPVEREAVKAAFPEIRTIGSDPFVIRRILLWAPETQLLRRNQVTLEREDMLKKQVVRESSRVTLSREEFLASLNCSIKWRKMLNFEDSVFPRVYELVNKTNQFNTNGKRWSCEYYRRHFEMGGKVLSFQVEDNYTSYGLVGVLFIINAEITQCVMSCRVLGMEVEQAIIALAVQEIRNETSVAVIKAGITETSS